MRVVATSDLHGNLPKIPKCDVLIVAGDVLPLDKENGHMAAAWVERIFKPWLENVPADRVVAVAGNHDFLFEAVPDIPNNLPWDYLRDSGVYHHEVLFWGYPWTPNLKGWAFYGSDLVQCNAARQVPNAVGVTITHSPPLCASNPAHPDWASPYVQHMIDRVKPRLHVSGHIHEGYGTYADGQIRNVSHCDIMYNAVNPPHVVDI